MGELEGPTHSRTLDLALFNINIIINIINIIINIINIIGIIINIIIDVIVNVSSFSFVLGQ